ncbi:MAG: IS110 family transposase [Ignavibacteriales bacterium]|nr:IS110 family transposase [Ignavibacteriales bacterium]
MKTLKVTKADFTGQDIYTALDVGLKSWKVCIMTETYEHKTFTQPPDVDTLVDYLHRNFPGARYHCVYEAGYCGFWIHEQLTQRQVDCIVVNPADVPTKDRERAFKSDGVDTRKLGRGFRSGDLDAIYVPSRASQEDRSLVRTRFIFIKKQTRCKNQIKALLSFYGIVIPPEVISVHWSRRYVAYLEHLTFQQDSGTQALKILLDELCYLRTTIARVTKSIRLLSSQQRYEASVKYLVSIPGISTVGAMILLTELVDIHRFRSLDQLASYVGLVPGEHSSGEQEITTGISRRRNPFLRGVLIECAWVAARKDPALLLAFTKLSKRMPKNDAIIRIAHKLLNRIRYVLLHQQYYQSSVVATEAA